MSLNRFVLSGRVAVVTGGTTGSGHAIALRVSCDVLNRAPAQALHDVVIKELG
jgi:NAD(P)-dependent dehydrogenase (short-subunit alcohol dehydrogenase family)